MKKTILTFGILIICLLALFQLSKYSITSGNMKIEYAVVLIAIVFFIIGIVLNKKSLQKKHSVNHENEIDQTKVNRLGISKREYEILVKISEGLSNKEIADVLFVSENTVKTHVSNLYSKLDVKRRTQALQKAKEMKILY